MDKQYIEHLERLAETAARLENETAPVLRAFHNFLTQEQIQLLNEFQTRIRAVDIFKTENPQNE